MRVFCSIWKQLWEVGGMTVVWVEPPLTGCTSFKSANTANTSASSVMEYNLSASHSSNRKHCAATYIDSIWPSPIIHIVLPLISAQKSVGVSSAGPGMSGGNQLTDCWKPRKKSLAFAAE